MRRGETVARMATGGDHAAEIARAMVGREVALGGDAAARAAAAPAAEAALTVTDLVGRRTAPGARGRRCLLQRGAGRDPRHRRRGGQRPDARSSRRSPAFGAPRRARCASAGATSPRSACANGATRGLAHIPEDRHRRGLILDYIVADNLILGRQHRFRAVWRSMAPDRDARGARSSQRSTFVRATARCRRVRSLVATSRRSWSRARWARDFKVLLAAQPTRGVDVGAIEFIHARLRAARDAGKAVLLVSADLAEVLALADRIAVMYGGRIVAMCRAPSERRPTCSARFMTGAARARREAR